MMPCWVWLAPSKFPRCAQSPRGSARLGSCHRSGYEVAAVVGRGASVRQFIPDEVPHDLSPIIDSRGADLDEAKCGVERIRFRIWRQRIHLTGDRRIPQPSCPIEEIFVQQSAETLPSMLFGNDDAVDVEELIKPLTEP